MRTSSVKIIASALAIVLTLTVAASADARPQSRRSQRSRGEAIVRTVMDLIKRIGKVTTNGGPSVPINEPQGVMTPDAPDAPTLEKAP